MALKKCDFCPNKVPKGGQCNKCGFIDGLQRMPNEEEFRIARKVNADHSYDQYKNLDMLLMGLEK